VTKGQNEIALVGALTGTMILHTSGVTLLMLTLAIVSGSLAPGRQRQRASRASPGVARVGGAEIRLSAFGIGADPGGPQGHPLRLQPRLPRSISPPDRFSSGMPHSLLDVRRRGSSTARPALRRSIAAGRIDRPDRGVELGLGRNRETGGVIDVSP
jgi:hypothetical protein